jgi:hypothetical protein
MTQPDTSVIAPTTTYSPHSDRAPSVDEPRVWTLAQRFGFRLMFVYVLLYTYPGPLDELPGVDFLGTASSAMWLVVVPWVGTHVLRLSQPVSIRQSGSGDKLFDWVQVFTMVSLAVIAAVVWTRFRASVRLATDSLVMYGLRSDTVKHTATFMNGPDTSKKIVLAYAFPDSQHLVLRGHFGADSVEMTLRRRSESSYLLVKRGFHWVNEVPYFR